MSDKTLETQKVKNILENLSTQDFKAFGLHQISYIRRVEDKEEKKFIVCGADGEEICMTNSVETALVMSRQNDLEPVTCH